VYSHFKTALQRIVSKLNKEFPGDVVSVYAFGSRVRADHAAGSDFDVLVLVNDRTVKLEEGIVDVFVDEEMKTGLLPVEIVKSMKLLLSRRTDVDYGDFESIDTAEAEDSIAKAESILRRIDEVRKKLIEDLAH